MAYKVWYRNRSILEVELAEDGKAALRRAAAIFTHEGDEDTDLCLVGVEDDRGELVEMEGFDRYLSSYRMRDIEDVDSPKWHIEVSSPMQLRESVEDEWVRYSSDGSLQRAKEQASEVASVFGQSRVRIVPSPAITLEDANADTA